MKNFWRTNVGKGLLFVGTILFAALFLLSVFLLVGMVESGFYWRTVEEVFFSVVDMRAEQGIYELTWQVVNIAYQLRYWIVAIGVGLAFLSILCFVSLLAVAGRKPGSDEIYTGGLHKVWYELLCCLLITCIPLTDEILYHFYWDYFFYVMTLGVCIAGMLCFFMLLCMTTAVRIKGKTFWKSTFCCWAIHILSKASNPVFGILKMLWSKIAKPILRVPAKLWSKGKVVFLALPMLWRTVAVVAGITLLELIALLSCWYVEDFLVFWYFEKLILVPAALYGAWCLRQLQKGGIALAEGDLSYHTDTKGMFWDLKNHGDNLNSIAVGMTHAVEERMKSERMKTELITNVSHDIKTPLTSIINYASLIGNEKCDNEKITQYSEVLVRQSERLKRLIEDLVEASKASTGNLDVFLAPCNANVFLTQAEGEYVEKLEAKNLSLVVRQPEKEVRIQADGRRMWRIFDNLMGNICKYAQPGTRVYLTLEEQGKNAVISFKNISAEPLDLSEEALMERFVRGDQSRNTEGNGLGLSIAKSMAELQNGSLSITVDGDLFKAVLTFPMI